MQKSLAQWILESNKPFIFYHTHKVDEESILRAIKENRSMDLDVCISRAGNPYIGHSEEYYEKSGEIMPDTISLESAVSMLSKTFIPVIVDCKHYDAWGIVKDTITTLGEERCLVHAFVKELKFKYESIEPDYLTEWNNIKVLSALKEKFPFVTSTVSAKGLPKDLSLNSQYRDLLETIKGLLIENQIDTVCLNVPNKCFSNELIEFFTRDKILPHVGVDDIDQTKLSTCYIGETDILGNASTKLLVA